MNPEHEPLQALKDTLASGDLTSAGLEQKLAAAIEAEYKKEHPSMRRINAWEDLLWEIRTEGKMPFASRVKEDEAFLRAHTKTVRTGRSWPVLLKGCAAAAVLVLLTVFSFQHEPFAWMTGETIDDGERYLLRGHEINLEFIQNAIADHQEESRLGTESLEEIIGFLGFVPQLPDVSCLEVQKTYYSATFISSYIKLTVSYQLASDAGWVSFTSTWFTDAEHAYLTLEQNSEGTIQRIAGQDVYIYMNTDRAGFTWSEGLAVHVLSGNITSVEGQEIVEHFLQTNRETGLPFIQNIIDHHAAEAHLESDSLEEIIDFLGFAPHLPDLSGLDVQRTRYTVHITDDFISIDVLYKRNPKELNIVYSCTWFTNADNAYYSLEQNGEGKIERIAGQEVYCYMNVDRPGFTWSDDLVVHVLSGGITQDEGREIVRRMLLEMQ